MIEIPVMTEDEFLQFIKVKSGTDRYHGNGECDTLHERLCMLYRIGPDYNTYRDMECETFPVTPIRMEAAHYILELRKENMELRKRIEELERT